MEYVIKDEKVRQRIDAYLTKQKLGLSRSYIQKLIDQRKILVNDNPTEPSYKLKIDDKITIEIPPPQKLEVIPENLPLNIVYEDEDLMIINKPAGMLTHPAAGNYTGTLVNALLYHVKDLSGIGGVLRPGIVHRLDKGTSGLILIAKSDLAHQSLSKQFKDRTIKKIYVALVQGVIKKNDGFIQEKIGRHPVHRKKFTVIKNPTLKSKEALTFFKVIQGFNHYTLLELQLKTGRTHQIRVHMSHLGHPLVGDKTYGGKTRIEGLTVRTLLHAKTIGLVHPRTGKYLEFEAPMPADMREIVKTIALHQREGEEKYPYKPKFLGH